MSDGPALSRTGIRGLGFHVLNTGKGKDKYRLYTTAQWSEKGVQQHKLRSISIRGVPRAAHLIAGVLVANHPAHQGKDVDKLADRCQEALDELIMQIHNDDHYPTDRGLNTEDQLQAVHEFVENSPRLPPSA